MLKEENLFSSTLEPMFSILRNVIHLGTLVNWNNNISQENDLFADMQNTKSALSITPWQASRYIEQLHSSRRIIRIVVQGPTYFRKDEVVWKAVIIHKRIVRPYILSFHFKEQMDYASRIAENPSRSLFYHDISNFWIILMGGTEL